MSLFDQAIEHITAQQLELAKSSLTAPAGTSLFDYGRACGLYQGLGAALDILKNIVKEDQERMDDL
jgi:hypothetical protein